MLIFWGLVGLMLAAALFLVFWPLGKQNYLLTLLLCLLVLLGSLGLYQLWGDSAGLSEYYQQQKTAVEVEAFLQEYENFGEVIEQLEQRLQYEPGDSQGWYLLGRLYVNSQRFTKASEAFGKANQLKPGDPQIMLQYALSLYFAQGNDLQGESEALLEAVLTLEPDNIDALNLLAVDAYQKQKYEQAIAYWERLLDLFPVNSEERELLLQSIALADNRLSEQNEANISSDLTQ